MTSEKGPSTGDATLRRRIKPWEFETFFDPRELRKETCLLYEIKWGTSHKIWRNTGLNTTKHVEINFIEKFTSERNFSSSVSCCITWFLSWSPCWECCKAIKEFLSQHSNVTLVMYVARIFHHMDPQNRQELRDLVITSGVTVQIMRGPEYDHCWRNFVNYPPGEEAHWPRYPPLWMKLYALELHCIILSLPPCLKISRRYQHQQTLFSLKFQNCHFQMIPPYILLATEMIQPSVTWR
ncbi:PREDICTED: c-_U-editing enzyme APOBEC-1 [Chrysochloris asiatica]|uniref:C->U-editing enzyme APOBEC-1 n=1 Tax=Chrysochloris asiatica TaxID=185453 RepID=A0A9B0X0L4_CHRAS|nr:PREDICTED: c->U-editing enzyme APOBEC-1 [Chrysochloris asiatica]